MAIQIRRGTDSEWESNKSNIVAGEPAVAMDSERMFVGTGSGTYMELANLDVLADAFDSSASYEVGDFAAYHGKVYKFTSTHSGAWNASDVEEVALADALDSLGEDVYTKAEADALLALKADASAVNSALALKADKSDTYTKAAVDASLALKADKSDTYTKTEVDNALALKADADDVYTKTETDTLLDEKANVDGSYEQMTVGNAEQIVTNLTDTESEPFTFRTSGGNLEIGDREELTVVGGSIAWNQTAYVDAGTRSGVTISDDGNGVASLSGSVSNTYVATHHNINVIDGHKYLLSNTVIANPNNISFSFSAYNLSGGFTVNENSATVKSATQTRASSLGMINLVANTDLTGIKILGLFIDLTQMFGSTIADYIYNLEQSTAGTGVAFFKKYFPKDYYTYNTGEMLHVQTSEFKTVGFNQWDEEWELGYYDQSGQAISGNSNIRSKNYIPVLPNTTYHAKGTPLYVCQYDADKNFIGTRSDVSNGNFITLSNAHFIRFNMGSAYGTTYKNDICINLHWDGTRDGEYEPYTEHSYALDSDLVLRGIPKLDADNNLYYDGDTYESDGTVTRKYGIVDLGTLSWTYTTDDSYAGSPYFASWNIPDKKAGSNNIVCGIYVTANNRGSIANKVIAPWNNTNALSIAVRDDSYTDAASFKSAMSGVYLVYELATPTTEEAEPYQSPQIVDNWGTEEFVVPTQSGVEIPVGHETVYPISLRDKLESAPNLPDDDGDYLLHMASGEASYKQLVSEFPSAPTTDGTYVLKATVSSGTATLTWEAE